MQTSHSENTQTIKSSGIVRESTFFAEFSSAVQHNDKAFYNLLMSMVSNDATDLDQFHQYKSDAVSVKSDLPQQFDVQVRKINGPFDLNVEHASNQFANLSSGQSIALLQLLSPQPIIDKEESGLPMDVINNLDLNVKQKYFNQRPQTDGETAAAAEEKPQLDVETWFKTLNESRAHSQSSSYQSIPVEPLQNNAIRLSA